MIKMGRSWQFAGIAAVVVLSIVTLGHIRSEVKLREFVQETAHGRPLSAEKSVANNIRARDLYRIWIARTQRDVTYEIAPFLQDKDTTIRQSAARALGRLKSPDAENLLEQLLADEQNKSKENFIPDHTLKLALGRVRSRETKGVARLEAVAQSVGLSYGEVVQLSQKVNDPAQGRLDKETIGADVVEETVDLLYNMAKEGDDVRAWADRLTLDPAQKVELAGGFLPQNQEFELILNSFSKFDVVMADRGQLSNHFLNMGEAATEALLQRLEDMLMNPEQYRQTSVEAYGKLFYLAAQTGDTRVLPLLEKFAVNPKPWPDIRDESQQIQNLIKWQIITPPLP